MLPYTSFPLIIRSILSFHTAVQITELNKLKSEGEEEVSYMAIAVSGEKLNY
jgi:hypothetical protein